MAVGPPEPDSDQPAFDSWLSPQAESLRQKQLAVTLAFGFLGWMSILLGGPIQTIVVGTQAVMTGILAVCVAILLRTGYRLWREESHNGKKATIGAAKTGLGLWVIFWCITGCVLDLGELHALFTVVGVGYWLGIAIVGYRRGAAPTVGDLLFLRYGLFPLFLGGPWLAEGVYYFIGKSTETGLHRLLAR